MAAEGFDPSSLPSLPADRQDTRQEQVNYEGVNQYLGSGFYEEFSFQSTFIDRYNPSSRSQCRGTSLVPLLWAHPTESRGKLWLIRPIFGSKGKRKGVGRSRTRFFCGCPFRTISFHSGSGRPERLLSTQVELARLSEQGVMHQKHNLIG